MNPFLDVLDLIAAKGNRGHHHPKYPDSTITCADGFQLSVIAGGGTYCTPRPQYCSCAWIPERGIQRGLIGWKNCDYPGPYSDVEVMILDGESVPEWDRYEAGGVYAFVPVPMVRDLIEAHGGVA